MSDSERQRFIGKSSLDPCRPGNACYVTLVSQNQTSDRVLKWFLNRLIILKKIECKSKHNSDNRATDNADDLTLYSKLLGQTTLATALVSELIVLHFPSFVVS